MAAKPLRIDAVVRGPDGISYTFDGKFYYNPAKGWTDTKEIPDFFNTLNAIDSLYYLELISLEERNERRQKVLHRDTKAELNE